MTKPSPLNLVRLRVEARRVADLGLRRAVPEAEAGYLMHMFLKEVFGEEAPGPFAVTDTRGNQWTVFAYTARSKEELRHHAEAFAPPELFTAIDWERFDLKPMPADWSAGARVGFVVRACPSIRLASDRKGSYRRDDKEHPYEHSKGYEVDAWLIALEKADPIRKSPSNPLLTKESVYGEWLAAQLQKRGVTLEATTTIDSMKRERLVRRTHGATRQAVRVELPDVTFSGTFRVDSGEEFLGLLRRGVGRHRAFGFGMLLLRPARGG